MVSLVNDSRYHLQCSRDMRGSPLNQAMKLTFIAPFPATRNSLKWTVLTLGRLWKCEPWLCKFKMLTFAQEVVRTVCRYLLLKMQFQGAFSQNKDISHWLESTVSLWGTNVALHRDKTRRSVLPTLVLLSCAYISAPSAMPALHQSSQNPLSRHKSVPPTSPNCTHQTSEKQSMAITLLYVLSSVHPLKIWLMPLTLYPNHSCMIFLTIYSPKQWMLSFLR